MKIIGVDPGPEKTAFAVLEDSKIIDFGFGENLEAKRKLKEYSDCKIGIESITFMGGFAGESVFNTAIWVGRFIEALCLNNEVYRIDRKKVKKYFNVKNKENADSRLRYEMILRHGKQGAKKNPGPTYGIASHVWSALAIATMLNETKIKSGDRND